MGRRHGTKARIPNAQKGKNRKRKRGWHRGVGEGERFARLPAIVRERL